MQNTSQQKQHILYLLITFTEIHFGKIYKCKCEVNFEFIFKGCYAYLIILNEWRRRRDNEYSKHKQQQAFSFILLLSPPILFDVASRASQLWEENATSILVLYCLWRCNKLLSLNLLTMTNILTIGFLYSFGLMHLMKKGLHWLKVFINDSRDFLNCDDKVGALFRVSEPMFRSSLNRFCRNLFLDTWISWSKSAENVSRFFSKKFLVS